MRPYPGIAQSIGLLAFAFLVMLVTYFPFYFVSDQEYGYLLHYIIWMGATIAFGVYMRNRQGNITSFNFKMVNISVLPWVIAAHLAGMFGIIMPLVSLIPMNDFFRELFLQMADMNGAFSAIMIVIAAPLLEEILFRGIILDGFLKRYSPVKSIVISSVLFGVLHLNPWQFISATVFGILMGWVYYRTGSLVPTILLHFINNFVAFLQIQFTTDYEKLLDEPLMEFYGGLWPMIAIIGISIMVLPFSLYQLHRKMPFAHAPVKNNHPPDGEDSAGNGNML